MDDEPNVKRLTCNTRISGRWIRPEQGQIDRQTLTDLLASWTFPQNRYTKKKKMMMMTRMRRRISSQKAKESGTLTYWFVFVHWLSLYIFHTCIGHGVRATLLYRRNAGRLARTQVQKKTLRGSKETTASHSSDSMKEQKNLKNKANEEREGAG